MPDRTPPNHETGRRYKVRGEVSEATRNALRAEQSSRHTANPDEPRLPVDKLIGQLLDEWATARWHRLNPTNAQ